MKESPVLMVLIALATAAPAFADGLSLAPAGDGLLSLITPQPANPHRTYQPLSFDEDWRFLKNPADHDLIDPIKYIPLGTPDLTLSFGGSTRVRYEDKINAAFGGTTATAPTKDDDYFLSRIYLHADLRYHGYARVFAEGVFAYIDGSTRNPAPTPFPVDSADLHQLFVDLSPFSYAKDGFGLTLRLGRQELLFDKQKLVGPLDWANVRRTWDGGSVLAQWEQYQAEVFWVRPAVDSPYTFDTTDDRTNFVGFHLTHPLINADNHFALFSYYLNRDSNTQTVFKPGVTNFDPDGKTGKTDRVTVGARIWGTLPANFDYDLEGGPQFGRLAGNDILASYFSGELGYSVPALWGKPRLSIGYDYASGDHRRDGQSGTFDQLFPTGHIQFGSLDFVGRQNVSTPNVALTVNPTPELKLWTSWRYYWLADAHDALYNAAGAALRFNSAGTAGTNVGNEWDINGSYQLGRHTTLMVGYGIFFPGDFIHNTGKSEIAQMVYSSVEFKF